MLTIERKWKTLTACWLISMTIMIVAARFDFLQNASHDLLWQTGSIMGIILFIFGIISTSDPYGLYHIGLNVHPGDDRKSPPETEWLNMGYWKNTQIFPVACEALALKVIEQARCLRGGDVLDVGYGCGDSLLLHLHHPEVPRPASLTGITSIPSQHARSMQRVAKYQSSTIARPCDVRLFCGDAISRSKNKDHPLYPSPSTSPFTSIIALDCAYHFVSREVFLRLCYARLAPGGTIALADLAVSKPLPFVFRILLSTLLSVHPENMVTPEIYKRQLTLIGYANLRVDDISDDVFPGFQAFLRSRGSIWRIMDLVIGSWVAAGGRFLIVSASKPDTRTESHLNS